MHDRSPLVDDQSADPQTLNRCKSRIGMGREDLLVEDGT